MSSNDNFTKQLKNLIAEFVTPSGEILEYPTGRYYGRKQLDSRRLKLLRIFTEILPRTRFMRQETKTYISDKYITLKGVAEHMQSIGIEINANTVQSNIWMDMERVDAKLSKRILLDIVEYNTGFDEYEQRLLKTLAHYSNGHLFRNLTLKLPEPIMKIDATEEEFCDFVKCIAPYSPQHMAYLRDNMSSEMLGYSTYIISSTLLTEEEQERKDFLLQLLYKET
ncbi:MAG TPA: hypothetical protein PK733_18325 [Clostridiales bacterium]|nr:hypothetical protein [Clostridiales bacterium]